MNKTKRAQQWLFRNVLCSCILHGSFSCAGMFNITGRIKRSVKRSELAGQWVGSFHTLSVFFIYLISKTPCPEAVAPALRFVLSEPFYHCLKKEPIVPLAFLSLLLCAFFLFQMLYHRAPLEPSAPSGFSCFFGDKLWQEAQESWASLPAWPSPHSSPYAL